MARSKHSYVPFYFDDWAGGTAAMPRTIWSVYFQVCAYNWDKVRPMPVMMFSIITSDIEGGSDGILQALLETEKLAMDESGIYSPRALEIAQESFDLWKKKSDGGKAKGAKTLDKKGSSKTHARKTSRVIDTPSHPIPSHVEKNNPSGYQKSAPEKSADDGDQDEAALAKIEEAKRRSAEMRSNCAEVMSAWNQMAVTFGLPQVERMNDKRVSAVAARIGEYGKDRVLAEIGRIPLSAFLTGRRGTFKATFDGIVAPEMFTKLCEGNYHNDGQGDSGKPSGWRPNE